jgi:hypothetical protein
MNHHHMYALIVVHHVNNVQAQLPIVQTVILAVLYLIYILIHVLINASMVILLLIDSVLNVILLARHAKILLLNVHLVILHHL